MEAVADAMEDMIMVADLPTALAGTGAFQMDTLDGDNKRRGASCTRTFLDLSKRNCSQTVQGFTFT